MELVFLEAKNKDEIKSIVDYNLGAFSDSPDFDWNYHEILKEVENGWKLFSVNIGEEIIAAIFYKIDKKELLTKNSGIKINYQGYGHSHVIKEFFEKIARSHKLKVIKHYCRIDNFRTYSLNESHGYVKMTCKEDLGRDYTIEWEKKLK